MSAVQGLVEKWTILIADGWLKDPRKLLLPNLVRENNGSTRTYVNRTQFSSATSSRRRRPRGTSSMNRSPFDVQSVLGVLMLQRKLRKKGDRPDPEIRSTRYVFASFLPCLRHEYAAKICPIKYIGGDNRPSTGVGSNRRGALIQKRFKALVIVLNKCHVFRFLRFGKWNQKCYYWKRRLYGRNILHW